ncbi:MAG TPA: DUF2652 domain-containing protein [Flavitalea sp.]|nr:DUF2652 domain-containing protein [Flavitalea sp.]
MANQGLLFMPDISGFTKFIHQTEVDHSRFIIQELLEALINSNQLQLQVSEIEGDAILFYRFGEIPPLELIYDQVKAMFCSFHKILRSNSQRRICMCSACRQADSLTLKVVTHKGIFSTYKVKEYSKLIGPDIITVHHLLKNEIPIHEYWLISDSFFSLQNETVKLPEMLKWEKGHKQTENGKIDFYYSLLSPLKEELELVQQVKPGIKGKRVKILSSEKEYNVSIQKLFSVIGDISHKPRWMENVKGTTHISSPINQIGTSHQCLLDKSIEIMTTSDFYSDDSTIVMEETDKKKMFTCQFELVKKEEFKTLLIMNFFMKKNILLLTMFHLFMKNSFIKKINQSLQNLQAFLNTDEAVSCHC